MLSVEDINCVQWVSANVLIFLELIDDMDMAPITVGSSYIIPIILVIVIEYGKTV